MEKDLDPIVIKSTQTALGKYVKRPPLTEKLLKKPPFRFLHDIVTSVQKNTGFFNDLFDVEELVSDNVKDRERKIIFLNKVITVVGLTTGKTLSVKASKIVAGQEPEKTNELLQYLALALDKKLSSVEAVAKFKEGASLSNPDDKNPKESSKKTQKVDKNKFTSKSDEKLTVQKKELLNVRSNKNENDKINKTHQKLIQKEKNITKTESPPKKISQQTKPISKKTSIEKRDIINKQESKIKSNEEIINNDENEILTDTNDKNSEIHNHPESNKKNFSVNAENSSLPEVNLKSSNSIINDLNSSLSLENFQENENNEITKNYNDLNCVLHDSLDSKDFVEKENEDNHEVKKEINKELVNVPDPDIKIKEDENRNNESQIIKSPTKLKNVIRPFSVRPSSSRPGAPRLRDKHDNVLSESDNVLVGKVNIIAENTPNEEEEEASIIIIEQETNSFKTIHDEQEQLETSLNQHGHLVQQILDSQKEYSQISGKTEIEWEFGAQKLRDALSKEVEQLRYDIQGLSRLANPLGKLLDHIQEDVEVMRQELHQWTKSYEEANKELSKQKAANEDSLFPLHTKVKQLSVHVVEKRDKINDLKIIIYKNSVRIEKLLVNGNVQ